MNMAINGKKILEKATKGARKTYTISIDAGLFEAFKQSCEDKGAKYSSVIEELIKDFLESFKKKGK